jgi:hypothetical protein
MSSINYTTIAALSGDNSKGVSLCIPFVFNNIVKRRIMRVFINLQWGWVERIDLNLKEDGSSQTAFIHFAPGKFRATNVLEALAVGQKVKIVYDNPWFWNISLSRHPKPDESPKAPQPEVQISEAPALTRQVAAQSIDSDTGHPIPSSGAAELVGGMNVECDSLQPDEERGPHDD